MMNRNAFFLALIVLIMSCSKKADDTTTNSPFNSQTVSLNGRDPSNALNAYDLVGVIHNAGLDHIKNYLEQNPTANYEDVLPITKAWCETTYSLTCSTITITDIDDDIDDFDNGIVGYDEPTMYYYDILTSIVNDADNYANFDAYKGDIVALEDLIMADEELTEQQSTHLLRICSITRYSSDYWWDVVPPVGVFRLTVVGADKHALKTTWVPHFAYAVSGAYAYRRAWEWLTSD